MRGGNWIERLCASALPSSAAVAASLLNFSHRCNLLLHAPCTFSRLVYLACAWCFSERKTMTANMRLIGAQAENTSGTSAFGLAL